MLRYSDAGSRARSGPGTRSARVPAPGSWRLPPTSRARASLLNHLITEELPFAGGHISNPTRSPASRLVRRAGEPPARRRPKNQRKPSQIATVPSAPGVLGAARNGACRPRSQEAMNNPVQPAPKHWPTACSGHRPEMSASAAMPASPRARSGTPGRAGPTDLNAYGRAPTGTFFNRVQTSRPIATRIRRPSTSPRAACTGEDPPACLSAHRCQLQAQERRYRAGGLRQVYRLSIIAAWPAPTAPVSSTRNARRLIAPVCGPHLRRVAAAAGPQAGLREGLSDWRPPVRRRQDPDSEVSQAIRERGGYQLMPEWETQPANHYLPRQVTGARCRRRSRSSGWAIS